jgi:diphosphomevalonate decarboxylase
MSLKRCATARAHPNIALVKYWGKRDLGLNLPAAGSISITLDTLKTETRIEFGQHLEADSFELNDQADPARLPTVTACLDRLRMLAHCSDKARVISHNNFPTAAGLASSASGFAALVYAGATALGLELSATELSIQARQGSGSAARSIFPGFVEMQAGQLDDGSDSYARCLATPDHWPLSVVVAITSDQTKSQPSSKGMELTRLTSPFYSAWIRDIKIDLPQLRQAINDRDFEQLALVSEHSCLKMHAVMLSSKPGLVYWNGATVACIHAITELRRQGLAVFFTIDAGPQVKAICLPEDAEKIALALASVDGVQSTIITGLGEAASSLDQ